MLTVWGLLIVTIFMVLIMTKRATPFTALVLSPVVIALFAGFGPQLGTFSLDGVKGVAPTVIMLLFAILYFGLMLTAGLFDPLVRSSCVSSRATRCACSSARRCSRRSSRSMVTSRRRR